MSDISESEIIAFIAQMALTYIFVSVATSAAAKQNSIDSKRDLRTTKEDLMAELKDTRETLLRESEVSTTTTIEVIKAEIKKGLQNGD